MYQCGESIGLDEICTSYTTLACELAVHDFDTLVNCLYARYLCSCAYSALRLNKG